MFYYQNIFYNTGYGMLPMPYFHMWNIVLYTYLLGLVYTLTKVMKPSICSHSVQVFFLTVLGLGLFVYYQGRSHDEVFSFVWYPAIIIMGFCYMRLENARDIKESLKFVLPLRMIFLLIPIIAFIAFNNNASAFVRMVFENQKLMSNEFIQWKLFTSVDYIKSHLKQEKEVFFLSQENSPYFYYATSTKSFCNVSDLNSILTNKEVDKVSKCLKENKKHLVFLDNAYWGLHWVEVDKALHGNYKFKSRSIDGLEVWTPKNL
jgi:hypothetical protein